MRSWKLAVTVNSLVALLVATNCIPVRAADLGAQYRPQLCEDLADPSQMRNSSSSPVAGSQGDSRGKREKLMAHALFWGVVAADTLWPVLALAKGGFSGSGGGGGVATFKTKADAVKARRQIDSGKTLSDQLLSNATLRTLESWEMQQINMVPFLLAADATWQDYYSKAKSNLRMLSPITARRLDQVSEWMAFSDWDSVSALPLLLDATPSHELDQLSVRIQLAIRLSDGNSQSVDGPTRLPPKLKVVFNQKLFSMMHPRDQAILVLHEELYALGQSGGHTDSNAVRPLIEILFAERFSQQHLQTQSGLVMNGMLQFVKTKLNYHFGDYAVYFADAPSEKSVKESSLPRTADRHFHLFVDIVTKLRQAKGRCVREGLPDAKCAEHAMTEFLSRQELTEEEAFVFMSYFFLEKLAHAVNSEAIMDNMRSPEDYKVALDFTCSKMLEFSENLNSSIPEVKAGILKAVRYCHR